MTVETVPRRTWARGPRSLVFVAVVVVALLLTVVFLPQDLELHGEPIIDRVTQQGFHVEAAIAPDRDHPDDDPCPRWRVHVAIDGIEQFGGPQLHTTSRRGGGITNAGASLGATISSFVSVIHVPEDVVSVQATYGDARDAMAPVGGWAVLTGGTPVSSILEEEVHITFTSASGETGEIHVLSSQPSPCAADA